jgi:hypothetical protein
MIDNPLPPGVTSKVSGRDERVSQSEAEHQAEVHSQQLQKHSQQRSREPHWHRRFAHAFWRPRFGSWRY